VRAIRITISTGRELATCRHNGWDFAWFIQKKADVAEHPEEFRHVGLLANEPLSKAEMLSI
jgi:hypothetical protein